MKTDKALATARQFLDEQICECGHTEAEHYVGKTRPWPCAENGCECGEFRAVRFTVERAK